MCLKDIESPLILSAKGTRYFVSPKGQAAPTRSRSESEGLSVRFALMLHSVSYAYGTLRE